jgi:hypothetical protein
VALNMQQHLTNFIKSGLLVLTGFALSRVNWSKTWYRIELALPDPINPMLVRSSVPWYDSDEETSCAEANERRRAWLVQQLENKSHLS